MSKKYIVISFGLIVLIIVVVVGIFLPKRLEPGSISIDTVEVKELSFTIKGTIIDSAIGYKGYSIKVEDNRLIVEIKGGLSFGKRNGQFLINIEKNDFANDIKEIFLNRGTNSKKIWPQ